MLGTAIGASRPGRDRPSKTYNYVVEGYRCMLQVVEGEAGRPEWISFSVYNTGTPLLHGMVAAFCQAVSVGLQNGIPFCEYVRQFMNSRFEPVGMTDNEDFRFASSVLDVGFKIAAVDYLTADERHELGILTVEERMSTGASAQDESSPWCMVCGVQMSLSDSCYACPKCGATDGSS
jgi:ribonucleoside-diphosphate reductase alpha chain